MQRTDKDPLYTLVRITGPTHNLLRLQISKAPTTGEPELEVLELASDQRIGAPVRLDGREVVAQVMLGVEQACAEVQRAYHVEKIQYVLTDSGPAEVYRYLAAEIIRRVHALRAP